jgi:anti-anti-sigma factor
MSGAEPFKSNFFVIERDGDVGIAVIQRQQLSEEDNLEEFGVDLTALLEKLSLSQVVIDLNRVKYITSAAIGRLIAFHRRVHRDKGTLVLCDLTSTVRDILQASQLLSYFKVAEGRSAAVALMAG